jgi:hypothetical protein
LLAEEGSYAFARIKGEDKIIVALNATSRARRMDIPCSSLGWNDGRPLQDCINGERYVVGGGKISLNLPGWSGIWIG